VVRPVFLTLGSLRMTLKLRAKGSRLPRARWRRHGGVGFRLDVGRVGLWKKGCSPKSPSLEQMGLVALDLQKKLQLFGAGRPLGLAPPSLLNGP
jgi:hypothetical protein